MSGMTLEYSKFRAKRGIEAQFQVECRTVASCAMPICSCFLRYGGGLSGPILSKAGEGVEEGDPF